MMVGDCCDCGGVIVMVGDCCDEGGGYCNEGGGDIVMVEAIVMVEVIVMEVRLL